MLRTVCVFPMNRSNVRFVGVGDGVCVNTRSVVFDGSIPVGAESRALLCVGNAGKGKVKVQFVASTEHSEKVTYRAEPAVVTLERGMACEFSVFVTPHCTCTVKDTFGVVVRRGDGKTVTKRVCVDLETEMTTVLHYNDVVCETQIGEGSFGVVFRGTFQGSEVAVKKMKEVGLHNDAMSEFMKEISMLDKIRCNFIVHFYGACTIPNHEMLVTEFAPWGSLADCIRGRDEPDEHVKAKLMLDAAKGLEYLHSNGILHRDIKPDNVLVFSLDGVVEVNGKLTDFGSSRNINLLMTNMTFTKGVGTPVYMAPEVINKEKYKKPADVFSFGVMLFECFKWGDAYPKECFKYPWDIVGFVNTGRRIACPAKMRPDVYKLVSRCWSDNPTNRNGLVFDMTRRCNISSLFSSRIAA